ncbi:hypothetical protein B5807_10138 [Epicoccum nigrum]|jgi:hypothetical protein|uniref:Uncharacterized protein n=1 Tax=Epicoccum nigrum TaxID=105696 RepID=A0A1Y2LP49_EPING|nr:hypothetical protein B5807_10138 [Epicoccum nigrum]
MSQDSSQSPTGLGPASSPFGGTDPTLYSPEFGRFIHPNGFNHRSNIIQATVPDNKPSLNKTDAASPKYKGVLPVPAPYYQGQFANELSEDDKSFISRFHFITHLPDGTNAGADSEHELFSIQQQMKLVSHD